MTPGCLRVTPPAAVDSGAAKQGAEALVMTSAMGEGRDQGMQKQRGGNVGSSGPWRKIAGARGLITCCAHTVWLMKEDTSRA
jgi:hypothetical protein